MSADVLAFRIDGVPVPKGRARTFVKGGRVITTTPPRTRKWEAFVRVHAMAAVATARWMPIAGAYAVSLTVFRARRAGDADNFAKGIGDALNGVAYPDDRSVRRLTVELVDGQPPGVMVRIERVA